MRRGHIISALGEVKWVKIEWTSWNLNSDAGIRGIAAFFDVNELHVYAHKINRRKTNLFNKIFKPLSITKFFPVNILIWIAMVPILGNIVLIMSGLNIEETLHELVNNGYFYSFAISLVLSCFTMFFNELAINERIGLDYNFKAYKIIITIFALILFVVLIINATKIYYPIQKIELEIPMNRQIVLYIITLLLTFYLYCISLMSNPVVYDNYKDLENKNIEDIIKESNSINDDGEGVGL